MSGENAVSVGSVAAPPVPTVSVPSI